MAYQYQTFGYVTKSMLLVSFFHFLYVLDFFYNEDWYLRTIDITHDHFGFTLAWGDTAFLPNSKPSPASHASSLNDDFLRKAITFCIDCIADTLQCTLSKSNTSAAIPYT
jgi:hypothetical protein